MRSVGCRQRLLRSQGWDGMDRDGMEWDGGEVLFERGYPLDISLMLFCFQACLWDA